MRMRVVWAVALFATGCLGARKAASPAAPPEAPPAIVEAPPPPPAPAAPPVVPDSLDEAVRDALSGPLVHIGTGPWPGNHRAHACAYRNDRVIVVNVYCTLKEARAFRVDVFSPTRGRMRIYAEARAPVSTVARKDYFTFNAETQPPPSPRSGLPPVTLAMSFPELRAYEERRYGQFLPSCYGGVEVGRRQGGCQRELAAHAADWAQRNGGFLEQPPDEWHRLVRELRALASLHGRNME